MATMMTAFWIMCSFFSMMCGRPVCAIYFVMGVTYALVAVLVWKGRHNAVQWLYALIAGEHFAIALVEMLAS